MKEHPAPDNGSELEPVQRQSICGSIRGDDWIASHHRIIPLHPKTPIEAIRTNLWNNNVEVARGEPGWVGESLGVGTTTRQSHAKRPYVGLTDSVGKPIPRLTPVSRAGIPSRPSGNMFLDQTQHLRGPFPECLSEIEQGSQGWALLSSFQLADVVSVIPGAMGEGFLGVSPSFPKPTKNSSARNLRIDRPSGPGGFSRHACDCRALTTIVLPTYSVYRHVRRTDWSSLSC
jgi:hypothetical protein